MKLICNEQGIALVTSLMITLISLTMIMALLYMMTTGIQVSGMQKRYKTVVDATYGGADVVAKDILPYTINQINNTVIGGPTALITALNSTTSPYAGISRSLHPGVLK